MSAPAEIETETRAQLTKLGAEVSSSLEEARVATDAATRVRAKLVARTAPRLRTPPRIRRTAIAGALAFAATIAVAAFFAWPRTQLVAKAPAQTIDGDISFVVGEGKTEERGTTGAFIAAPAAAETPITFSDGSKLRLAAAARVRVAEVKHHGARVLIESGAMHVAVVHRDDTRWAVEAGPFEVRVTGTKFDVEWDPAATGLLVRMEEGSVFVRGCGLLGDEGRRLVAGEQLKVSCKDRALSVTPADAPAPALTPTATPDPTSAPDLAPASTTPPALVAPSFTALPVASAKPDGSRTVVGLARRGAHTEALAAAEANGFGTTCDALSGPELLLLADAARYAGRFERATEALELTRRRFAGGDPAATAAFELGRIAMDIRRELGAAGDHFETYLRERPNGSLAREALGRALEARHRAGESARAERLAMRYLAAYPDGPHAKLARKLTSPDGSRTAP